MIYFLQNILVYAAIFGVIYLVYEGIRRM